MSTFDLVDDFFCAVCEMPEKELDGASRALVDVWHSFGVIESGGFHGYLCSVGPRALTTAKRYRTVGLNRCSDLITSAHDLWRKYWPDPDPADSDPDTFRARFGTEQDRIEEEFYGTEDEIAEKLAQVVRAQQNTG